MLVNNNTVIEPLKFFCQKVLPLVYDDSLSYSEVLCKMDNKINEMVDFLNNYIAEYVEAKIGEIVSKLMLDVQYDATTETITLAVKERE